jgi:Tesmin/TSO1-like CXC domain, cysteine-rich domain
LINSSNTEELKYDLFSIIKQSDFAESEREFR